MLLPQRIRFDRRLLVAVFLVGAVSHSLLGEDLKTTGGRMFRDAVILRADSAAIVIQHRFGVVRIPFSEITAESRQKFNPQRAREILRQRHAQEKASGEKSHPDFDQVRHEHAAVQRATAEFEEQNQSDAEQLEERIRRQRTEPREEAVSTQRLRLRGEVIGVVPPDGALVLCEPADGTSSAYVRHELARLPNSPFAPPRPAETEVIVVTGLRQTVNEGQSVDLPVAAAGMKRDFRTRLGENYSGRYRVFRALD